jgi:cytochrome d ubiquinol oxidase subunit II
MALFIVASIISIASQPHLMENFSAAPVLWLVPTLVLGFTGVSLYFGKAKRPGRAFLFSSLAIAATMGTAGTALFPRLVPALGNLEISLTAANSSSSELTLKIMLVLTIIGMPIVIGYTIWVYRAFAGKVDVESKSNHY